MQPVMIVVTCDGGSKDQTLMETCAVIDFISHNKSGAPTHKRKMIRKQLPGKSGLAEIYAIYLALKSLDATITHCKERGIPLYLVIRSDSKYAINGCTTWAAKWKRRNYKKIKHDGVWKAIHTMLAFFTKVGTIKVGSSSSNHDTGPTLALHGFCHDACQELRHQNGREELCSLTLDHAPKFEFSAESVKWHN